MLLRLVLACFLFPLAALADALPQPQSDTISDFADILPGSDEAEIAALIRDIRDETGVHIVVVTMDRISNFGGWGQSFESYATALFNDWGIGDRTRNDGIMLLVVTGTRDTRIELGEGYARAFDRRAQEVIETAILPQFRERRMAQGIMDGIKATRDRIVQPFVKGEWVGLWRVILIGLGVIGGATGLVFAGKAAWAAYVRCPQCSQPGLSRWSEVISDATTYSSGRGVTHLSCSLCGYKEDRPYTIAARRDDDDGGSSSWGGGSSSGGFGGGRSSGGGASGKW
ncbi:TPM domain-containing protein [Tabrizicola sp.]|uniref:TPM domain-containing protein n=1 Tax=Tabrizicola sp. TaxID=2005166 RepID=UPI001A37E122|nr:TPM domain-containing protein [Tabrizicola sp.]MBL9072541.1 TPM domain-containing protein [Tabrizicola sp.]